MFAVFLGIFALVTVAAFCYFFGIWISYLGLLAGEALVWILKRVGVPLSDILKLVDAFTYNSRKEGANAGDQFWEDTMQMLR